MPRIAPPVSLAPEQANELRHTVLASIWSGSSVTRYRIILLACAGETNQAIANALEIPEQAVSKWRRRFAKLGMAGLQDSRRSGGLMRLSTVSINTLLSEVTKPRTTRTQWSVRSMARHAGVSTSHVQTLWTRNGIKASEDKIVSQVATRSTHFEWLRFLKHTDPECRVMWPWA